MRGLWRLASRDLVKFLFDDDILMPHAIGDLVDLLRATPQASFAFTRRHLIDEHGRVTYAPPQFASQEVSLDHPRLAQALLPHINNAIGEFSNILINRAVGVDEEDFLTYKGVMMRVVTDVGFFLTATERGPAVGQNRIGGGFRKHANQNSTPAYNPDFAIGLGEWELFLRGAYSDGHLPKEAALAGIDKLSKVHEDWSRGMPALKMMIPSLAELRARVVADETDVFDDAFLARWQAFVAKVQNRKAVAAEPGA
jgi:hypothetical protein